MKDLLYQQTRYDKETQIYSGQPTTYVYDPTQIPLLNIPVNLQTSIIAWFTIYNVLTVIHDQRLNQK